MGNARAALEQGELDYAIEASAQILKASPGCLAVRQLQRIAQLKKCEVRRGVIGRIIAAYLSARFLFARTKTPAQSMALAEKILEADPTSLAALKRLGQAARALDLPETAVFAFESIRDLYPDDQDNLLALGEAFLLVGKAREALQTAHEILQRAPVHAGAQVLLRSASVAQATTNGQWPLRTGSQSTERTAAGY